MRNGQILCVLALIGSAACTPGLQQASHTPSPAATSPRAIGYPSASPSAATDSTLTCRLPVISPTTSAEPVPGGWIYFPGGQFIRDPASLPGRLLGHVPSYDIAIGGWVPVELKNVAPDGATYVLHGDPSLPKPSGFYIADAATGTRKLILAADGPPQAPASWDVIDFASAGIYLSSNGIKTVPGLWLLDPHNGSVSLVEGSHYWSTIAVGSAWAVDPTGGTTAETQTYKVYRLDLRTREVSTWYQGPTPIRLLSPTPDGDLLVAFGPYGSERLELLAAPNQLVQVALPPDLPFVPISYAYLAHPGVWLPLPAGGIALYMKGEGVKIMTRSTNVFDVAGGCW